MVRIVMIHVAIADTAMALRSYDLCDYDLHSYGVYNFGLSSYGYTHCSKGGLDRSGPQNVRPCLQHTAHIAVQFSSQHSMWPHAHTDTPTDTHTHARADAHCCTRTVGLYIQVQLPESFGNLSALKGLNLKGCTGLVHTCRTTHMHTHICMCCMHHILQCPHKCTHKHVHTHARAHTQPHAYLSAWTFRFSYRRASAPWPVQSWPMKSVPM